jgi:predicted permease
VNSSRFLAVLSLAIGIALAVALSSIADAVLFRPLPVARPDEIVRVYSASPLHSLGFVSYFDYRDFARARTLRGPLAPSAPALCGMIAQTQVLLAVGARTGRPTDQPPEMRLGLAVSSNYFDVLGVPARLGRTFSENEDRQPVVILSDSFWRRRFAADPAILGRAVSLAQAPFTVIGVAPPGFGLDRFLHEDFYVPIGVYAAGILPVTGRPLEDRGRRYFSIYARRGAPVAAVQADLASIAAQLSREFPLTNHQQKVVVMTELAARLAAAGSMQAVAWILLALAALSVAAAASNAGGLLLLRSEARAGEYALKVALGASRPRLLREALAESLFLSTLGTTAAIPLAWAALKAAHRLWELPTDLPMTMDAHIDARMAMLAIGCAFLTTILCALAPAWVTHGATHPIASLRYTSNSRLRGALVILQVAFAAALLGSGASLLAGVTSVSHIDLGYRTDHILTMTFDPSQTQSDETRTRAFYRELLERTPQLPGVRAAALAQFVPLGFTAAQKQVKIAAASPDAISTGPMAVWMNTITPGYFELMRMPLIAGRDFNAQDTARTTPVVVVNEALARFWSDGRALGQSMEVDGRHVEVIGVVKTAKYQQVGEAPRPFFYLPYEQNFVPRLTLHVHTYGAPASIAPSVLAAARAIDPAQPASDIRPLDQFLSRGALFTARIGVMVTAAAGFCAWALSLTGLYACIASSVRRRRREIGIRRALGASRWSVTRLVLIQGAKFTLAGISIGLVFAAMAQHWAGQIASQNGSMRLPALALTDVIVAATSLAACLIPAWRASGLDPAVALRRT